ncbi:cytochrome P450 [Streptomyces sp. B1866]|uniref:cytochrome P450 n=1 Tax=Streptomyces sp. B1866 TaxID=3075431 RepID=UPI0028908A0B|nr:cytochrome P450 [Streptomyces sp. B1866]MDT3399303.1 cytochrome P450 [Streptomyces sp. B1866]
MAGTGKRTTGPRTAPGAVPVLGHGVPLLRDPLRFLSSLPACGDMVRIRIGPMEALMVCDPELARQVLLDDRTFDKGGPLFDRGREALGNGLTTCPHSQHRRQRRLVQPAFHHSRMPGYARVMAEQIDAVTGGWRDGQVLDVLAGMQEITTRIAVMTMFAGSIARSAHREVVEDFDTFSTGVFTRMFMPPPLDRLPTPGNLRFQRARARLRRTVHELVSGHRAAGVDHGDLLSILLTSRDDESADGAGGTGGGLSDAEASDQVISFLFAGTETGAATLAWALHLLARHPDVEKRLHEEADTVLAGRTATYDDLPRLEFAAQVITEALRLYPPGWMLTRTANTAARLGPYEIPAGSTVALSAYLLHHRPDVFPEPERFDPDRWAGPAGARAARSVMIPFSTGARKCIGEDFAVAETALTLATVAARWRLRPVPGAQVRPELRSIILKPRGLRMRLTARTPGR